MELGFDILLEDGPCLVINKPGGLLTQAPPGIDSVESRIKAFIKQRDEKPGKVYLGVPHRIDRPASGALIVTRHVRAARKISRQFQRREVGKTYWCWVEGPVDEPGGLWEDHVRKVPGEALAEICDADHPDAKLARLTFRVLERAESRTLLEIELETGRTHQIRVQAASRGHPVLGDLRYGATSAFGPQVDDHRDRWIALHARRLALQHPMTREPIDVTAPLPAYWDCQ